MTGNNPTDRSKMGTKRHILTDKKSIPLSAVISSASTHHIKLVTDVVDSAVIKRRISLSKIKNGRNRDCNIYVLIKHTITNLRSRN